MHALRTKYRLLTAALLLLATGLFASVPRSVCLASVLGEDACCAKPAALAKAACCGCCKADQPLPKSCCTADTSSPAKSHPVDKPTGNGHCLQINALGAFLPVQQVQVNAIAPVQIADAILLPSLDPTLTQLTFTSYGTSSSTFERGRLVLQSNCVLRI